MLKYNYSWTACSKIDSVTKEISLGDDETQKVDNLTEFVLRGRFEGVFQEQLAKDHANR
jgi:hypothetical protein